MQEISSISSGGTGPVNRATLNGRATAAELNGVANVTDAANNKTINPTSDRVELSGQAERIAALRQQIQDGNYSTEDKLNVAIDRMLEEIDAE